MKRTLSILLVLMLISASMLLANGTVENSQKSKDNGLVDIELWYTASASEAGPLPDDWVGYDIIRDKFGINLKAYSLPSNPNDQDVKIRTAMAANELPDFFVVSRPVWIDLVKAGLVADVTDCYAKMPHRTEIMFDDDAIAYSSMDGRSYGFSTPSSISKNEGFVIRKDWLDKLGLDIPKTTDELFDVMYAFTYNDPDGNGKDDTYGFGAFVETGTSYEIYPGRRFEPILGAFSSEGTWDMTADNFGLQIRQPEYYDFMVYLKKMIDAGVIDPTWMAYKKDDFRASWKQGKFGIMRENGGALHGENNYAPFDKNFPDGDWIVIDPPTGPSGHSSVGPSVRNMRIWSVSADAADAGKLDKICELFEWMSYGEGYILCCWGQEGINFVYNEEGLPVSTRDGVGFNEPNGRPYIQLRPMALNYKSDFELKSVYTTFIAKTSGKVLSPLWTIQDMQTRKWTNAMGEDSMPLPDTDLKTFYEQGIAEFLTGKRELNEKNWKEWVAQLDKMGAADWEKRGYEYAKENGYLK